MGQERRKQRLKVLKLFSSMRQKPVIPKKQSRRAVAALIKRAHPQRKVTGVFQTPLAKRMYLQQKAMTTLLIEESDSSSLNEGDSKDWKVFWVLPACVAILVVLLLMYLIREKIVSFLEDSPIDLDSLSDSLSRLTFFWDCLGFTVLTSAILFLIIAIVLAIVHVKARITKTETNFDRASFANRVYFFWILITSGGYVVLAVLQKEMLLQNLPAIILTILTIAAMSLPIASLRVFFLCFREAFCRTKKEEHVRALAIETMAIASFIGLLLTIVATLLAFA